MKPVTPLEDSPALASAIGLPRLLLKREDLHPYGSHKGRSIPVMIDKYAASGDRKFAVSGSGNASLAAALHIKELNAGRASGDRFYLDIFTGNRIAPRKADRLKALADDDIRVLSKERPLQALTQAMNDGWRSLRQSTDDLALEGYKALAEELLETEGLGAIFVGTSSGTTAQALAAHLSDRGSGAQVHIVQTSSCHPMASEFESYDGPDETSLADAIVDKTSLRRGAVTRLVRETGGYGWTATNDDILAAEDAALKHAGLQVSANSALSIAGAMKAATMGYDIPGVSVCIICGD